MHLIIFFLTINNIEFWREIELKDFDAYLHQLVQMGQLLAKVLSPNYPKLQSIKSKPYKPKIKKSIEKGFLSVHFKSIFVDQT